MKELYTEITITASINKVWKILTDFKEYPNWNPFIKEITGEVIENNTFQVTIMPPDSKKMTFKPKCLIIKENKELRWQGHLLIPGIFDGEHIFELEELNNSRIKLIQRELFKGILVPFLWKQLNTKTRKGFELMNYKLKELAENK
jgi:hypothetical protein